MKAFSFSRLTGLASLMLAAGVAQAAAREVVPIHSTVMGNGDLRYSVTVQVGSTQVEAQLDTGSVGLRVMPGVLRPGDAQISNVPEKEQYGSGVHLIGRLAQAQVGLGHLSVNMPIQWVDTVECDVARPKCMASWVPQKDFLIGGGDPRKGEGYKAIIGVGLHRSGAGNPLEAMGGRWIVVLPLPGQNTPGQLIINPRPDETQGFRSISLQSVPKKANDAAPFWKDHGLQSCLKRLDNNQQICGESILDTGAAGFRVSGDTGHPAWPAGIQAHYSLQMTDGSEMGQHFHVGDKSPTYVRFSPAKGGANFTGINAGLLTYFNNVVLYDQNAGVIALKARAH